MKCQLSELQAYTHLRDVEHTLNAAKYPPSLSPPAVKSTPQERHCAFVISPESENKHRTCLLHAINAYKYLLAEASLIHSNSKYTTLRILKM